MSNATCWKIAGIAVGVLFAAAVAAAVDASGEAAPGAAEPKLPYKLSYEIQTQRQAESNALTIDASGVVIVSIAHRFPAVRSRAPVASPYPWTVDPDPSRSGS
jgi:hypothetical protein